MPINHSLQATPEIMVPSFPSSLPTTIHLPESLIFPQASASPAASSPSAMSEAVSNGRGIIRRISRSARFPRRRGSQTNSHRDQSCGPTIFRRRSDSRAAIDNEISDLELESSDDVAVDDPLDAWPPVASPNNALGISNGRPSVTSAADSGIFGLIKSPLVLQQGTLLTKVTKKKKKIMKFWLDQESAKVCWESSRSTKQFYIDDVREFRTGELARRNREELEYSHFYEDRWITIIYTDPDRSKGRSTKTMHLIAPDHYTFQLWSSTLDKVSRDRMNAMSRLVGPPEKAAKYLWTEWMKRKFKEADRSEEEEKLDFADVSKLCRSHHINISEKELQAYFDEADDDRTGVLTKWKFVNFIRRVKERKDIKIIFNSMKPVDQTELDKATFFTFLSSTQKVNVDAEKDHWNAVFERFARSDKIKGTPTSPTSDSPLTMSLTAFQMYLESKTANAIFEPSKMDAQLTRPLNEYFISSSHNTYLLGRQVVGQSSSEAYIEPLQRGCRCIEIDCWDGNDGRPVVNHGRTMTTSCSFADCIKVINKYAFISSPYPLIISLEVHCNPDQQAIMTEIMKREFGDQLLLTPLVDLAAMLPSPEDLKGKILIKVKAPEEVDDRMLVNDLTAPGGRGRSHSSPFSRPIMADNTLVPNSPLVASPPSMSPPERTGTFWSSPRTSATSTATAPTQPTSADDSDSPPPTVAERRKKKTSNIAKVLGDLGVYTQGHKFTNFESPESRTYNHVFSLSERTFESKCKPDSTTKAQLEAHNMRYLMRVYPGQHRINSSNFDPIKFWRRGVQMAALNYQTYDLGRQINDAMFAAGTDCTGYILKPDEIRHPTFYSPEGQMLRKKPKSRVRFTVGIISAQQLFRPKGLSADANINPYVEFEMFCGDDKSRGIASGEGGHDASARNGMSGIGSPLRKRTQIVEGNGWDPNWQENLTLTLETKYPSLVFVRLTVWNSYDGRNRNSGGAPLGTFTGKLSSLEQGYRHLPLFDASGDELISKLFCRIIKDDHVPIEEPVSAVFNQAEVTSPTQQDGKPGIFKRVFSRTNSERKKKDISMHASRETDSAYFSRSSTFEK